jgi:trypsin
MAVVAASGSVTARSFAVRSPRAQASVIGGGGAPIVSFPFQVALYNPAAGSPMAGFFCGGVIVDAAHVITAAHCLAGGGHGRGSVSREIEVLAGSTRLDRPDPGSVRDPAAAVSVDPYYNPYTNDYDIGVVTLAHPLWSGANAPSMNGANPIAPLPIDVAGAARKDNALSPPALATVSGWGDTNPSPSGAPRYPGALRANAVPLVSEALCQEEYAAIEQTITPRMLCAGGYRPRADSCYGDSGGPLVVDRGGSPARPPADYVLVGLVDFGNGCAQPGFAGVYTRIADPAIARFLASGLGHRAKTALRRPGHKRKRHRARR